ncbi:MAG: phenylalanine--tRNA ligase beta subunit-related protein [Synergistetes bacterium]|nr:phenylalanine--tRNA ligase beta subunit-related protein [Synergistota bacterium]MCX8127469.1 phenylalanine--tRNA ligase beta subunit-related protein [Synergistota bacterium]MDW8192754.1 phenylalanine--tRNA ligase beta subunit-related protein [Synergistota bacterium]
MGTKNIIIDPKIFGVFPDFKRGVVLVDFMENGLWHSEIELLLREALELRRDGNWIEHDYVRAWDEAYKKFGSNPNRYPPSIKSLLKRIQKGGDIPFVNSVVALFNYISLKYLIPCGGDDVDKIKGNLRLSFAEGKEKFVPIGGGKEENPEPGEVIYFDDDSLYVMCRRWNWRNGDFSKITGETKRVVINLDGIGLTPEEVIVKARDELAELLQKYCSAKVRVCLLNKERNVFRAF